MGLSPLIGPIWPGKSSTISSLVAVKRIRHSIIPEKLIDPRNIIKSLEIKLPRIHSLSRPLEHPISLRRPGITRALPPHQLYTLFLGIRKHRRDYGVAVNLKSSVRRDTRHSVGDLAVGPCAWDPFFHLVGIFL